MVPTASPRPSNRILDSLPAEEMKNFLSDCDTVELPFGKILAEPGEPILHAYFPLDSIVSLIVTLESGARLELTMTANEGMIGASLMLGAQQNTMQALIQGAGLALRIPADRFIKHLEESPSLKKAIKRYLNAFMNQISQSAACAHFHGLNQRLARWLLMTHDRTPGDQLRLTHEFLSSMLGVRRSGVTVAAKALQSLGLIHYQRGKITVHDRPGLEAAACHCYIVDRQIHARLLNG